MKPKPISEGYHSVTPYLFVKEAAKAIAFYQRAFGATEIMRMPGPGSRFKIPCVYWRWDGNNGAFHG